MGWIVIRKTLPGVAARKAVLGASVQGQPGHAAIVTYLLLLSLTFSIYRLN